MIIAMGIAIILLVASVIMLIERMETKADKKSMNDALAILDECDRKMITTYNGNFSSFNTRLDSVNTRLDSVENEIQEIIEKMEKITNSIGDMEKRQDTDHNNLTDIRTRYVNYREPVNTGAGVPWAKDFPCLDEHE